MKEISLLLDLAREKAHGNEADLARGLGVPLHHPYEWRTGKRAISAESTVLLCNYLGLSGEEAREWVAIAVIDNPKNSSRAELFRKALFACWVAGVATLSAHQNDAQAKSGTAPTVAIEQQLGLHLSDLLYIHCRALAWLRRRLAGPVAACTRALFGCCNRALGVAAAVHGRA